ncbi:MAG TPA: response regulator [Verrucomicrobiae bacterium]|jgi:signal transduction histidine kinase|nr:response regulator [Verrucomicrobiae bacterium]
MLSLLTSDTVSEAGSGPGDRGRRTLLIVDDEEGPRQSLRVVFKDDYDLLLASNGQDAIELARKNKINAAVLDIRMTGMNGTEVLEKLKSIQPSIEVIMLTAYETVDTVRQALRLGACDYLNKPFDITTIRKAVATAMERQSFGDEIRSNNEKLASLQGELHDQKLQEEITRTRGEIYASIIHDINGPLTIISGFIQIINQRMGDSKRLEGDDMEMVKDRLKRITRQVSNCIDISHRYLSFMRQQPSSPARVSVNQILDDLRELLNVHPSKASNTLKVHVLAEDVELQINGTDLIQILLNLAINGLQCTAEPHLVDISGKVLVNGVDFSTLHDGPADRILFGQGFANTPPLLLLSIRDDGPGIPADVLPKVFQPYFTTKAPGKGTGLGLAIVHRLLKEARGCLHVHSKSGEGTTFNIYLPAIIRK